MVNDLCTYRSIFAMLGGVASQRVHRIATPLCLPNNCKWDSRSGQFTKTGAKRDSLYVVQEALQNLRTVKGKYHCLNKLEAFAIYNLKKFNPLQTNFKVSAGRVLAIQYCLDDSSWVQEQSVPETETVKIGESVYYRFCYIRQRGGLSSPSDKIQVYLRVRVNANNNQ